MNAYSLTKCRVVLEKGESPNLTVEEGKVASVEPGSVPVGSILDLKGCFVYPALINAHDHLRGNYLPRVGPPEGTYYLNWAPWDADLKASQTYVERSNLSVEQMYRLGAYKNLFSGVATVQDHFPHKLNEPHIHALPIRVLSEYCLDHEASSFDLKWGEGIETEHAWALERNWPFITHLEEGYDEESTDGVGVLERAGALDDHDLLIHCIGLSDEDIAKIAGAGASICWCPASNYFMFNTTCKIRKILKSGINVALGTDSTHTGSANLLAEIQAARACWRQMYGDELPPKTIFDMVTINAARALRIDGRVGSIARGKDADLLVLKANSPDPYQNLSDARMEDIVLLTSGGEPVYGDRDLCEILLGRGNTRGYGSVMVGGKEMLVKGDPGALLLDVRKAVGFRKKLDYLPFEV